MSDVSRLPHEVVERMPEWLHRYGSVKAIQIDDQLFVFRAPRKEDTKQLQDGYKYNPAEADQRYVENLLIWPMCFEFDSLFSADFNALLQTLWETTVFGDAGKFLDALDEHRNVAGQDLSTFVEAFICQAFGKTPDYVASLSEKDLLHHLVVAEVILGQQLPFQNKRRLSGRVDPKEARAQQFRERMERKYAARHGMWDAVNPEAEPEETEKDEEATVRDGRVNTAKENAMLMKHLPGLRLKYGNQGIPRRGPES